MTTDLTLVVTAHNETLVSGPTMTSADRAVAEARAAGFTVQTVIGLDAPTDRTRAYFEQPRFDHWERRVLDEAETKLTALRSLPPAPPGQTRDRGEAGATLRKAEGLLAGLPGDADRAARLAALQAALDWEAVTDAVVEDLRRVRLLTARSERGRRVPVARRCEDCGRTEWSDPRKK